MWSNSHEVTATLKILVLECLLLTSCLLLNGKGKLWCASHPSSLLSPYSTIPGACRKSLFQAKPSQFVPFVFFPRCLQKKNPSAICLWTFVLLLSVKAPSLSPRRLIGADTLGISVFVCVGTRQTSGKRNPEIGAFPLFHLSCHVNTATLPVCFFCRIFVVGIGFFSLCFLMTSLGGQFSSKRPGEPPFTVRAEGKRALPFSSSVLCAGNDKAGPLSGSWWGSHDCCEQADRSAHAAHQGVLCSPHFHLTLPRSSLLLYFVLKMALPDPSHLLFLTSCLFCLRK